MYTSVASVCNDGKLSQPAAAAVDAAIMATSCSRCANINSARACVRAGMMVQSDRRRWPLTGSFRRERTMRNLFILVRRRFSLIVRADERRQN